MTVKIACVVIDCLDALVIGSFWSAATGRPLDPEASSDFASIGFYGRRDRAGWKPAERDADPTWLFARVPEPKPGKNRLHLDVMAADLEAEIERLVGLGATRVADRDEYGFTWTLMTDPEGNEFDIAQALLHPPCWAAWCCASRRSAGRPRRRALAVTAGLAVTAPCPSSG
jgi:hypothetical protein